MSVNQSLLSRTHAHVRRSWRAVERDEQGSASIELGLGFTAVLLIGILTLDLYTLSKADTGTARVAATMADYISRERTIDGDEITALGQYLHVVELEAPVHLVYVISAVQQPTGDVLPTIAWVDDTIRLGETDKTIALASACRERGEKGWQRTLLGVGPDSPPTLMLPGNSVVIVVEVCAELLRKGMFTSTFDSGRSYRLHVLPVRDHKQRTPPAPIHTPRDPV